MTSRWHGPTRWRRYWGVGISVGGVLLFLTGEPAVADFLLASAGHQPTRVAQVSIPEEYSVRRGFPDDGSWLEVYDRSGRRTATLRDRSFGSMERWEMRDPAGRRIGEVRRFGTSLAPWWEIYDTQGQRIGTVREVGGSVAPRWDVYDKDNQLKGIARPDLLETNYFRRERENRRHPGGACPSSWGQESAFGSQQFGRHRPPSSTPLQRPIPLSRKRSERSWYPKGYLAYPAVPTPPVLPTPPAFPSPPTTWGQWPKSPPAGTFGVTPPAPRPDLSTDASSSGETFRVSPGATRPFGFGNGYEGFGHGNAYPGSASGIRTKISATGEITGLLSRGR